MRRQALNIARFINKNPFTFSRQSQYEDFYQLIKENESLRKIMEKPTIAERIEKVGRSVGHFSFTSMPDTFLNLSDFLVAKPIEFCKRPSIVMTWKENAKESIKNNVKHYIHGFQLLLKDVQQTLSIFPKVVSGRSITRREQKQIVRTISDVFRMVPVSIMIMLPVLEFLIPVIVKMYPNFLPSQFIMKDELQERKTLQAKIELAKFLKTTVEMMIKDGGTENIESGLPQFLEKLRSGLPIPQSELAKYSQLFRDELTLDQLDRTQLIAMCKFMDITPVGNDTLLRFQIRNHLRKIKKDDKLIYWEGVNSLNTNELIIANKDRGMRIGVEEKVLRSQLENWLTLSLEHNIPSSLLILSRTFSYLKESEKKIKEKEEEDKTKKLEKTKKKDRPISQTSETISTKPPELEQIKKEMMKKPPLHVTGIEESAEFQVVKDAINELTSKTKIEDILSQHQGEKSNTERLEEMYEEEKKIQEERENLTQLLSFMKDDEESYYMRKFLVKQLEAAEQKTKKEVDELEKIIKDLDSEMSSTTHEDIDKSSQKKISRVNKRLVRLMADIYGDIKTLEGMDEIDINLLDHEGLLDDDKKKKKGSTLEKEVEEFVPGINIEELESLFMAQVPDDIKGELLTKFIDEEYTSDEMMSEMVKELKKNIEYSEEEKIDDL